MSGKGEVGAVGSGERSAFEAAWRDHYPAVLRYCARRTGDRQQALDATSETFVTAWRRVTDLPGEPLPWLLGIARRTLANQWRGDRRRDALVARLSWQADFSGGDEAELEAAQAAVDAFNALGQGHREVLALSIWEGLKPREAAEVLGISASAFSVRLHRARKALREQLEPGAVPAPGSMTLANNREGG